MEIEDEQDFNELETLLYGQIHHDNVTSSEGTINASAESQTTLTQMYGEKKLLTTKHNPRYWSNNMLPSDNRYRINRSYKQESISHLRENSGFAKRDNEYNLNHNVPIEADSTENLEILFKTTEDNVRPTVEANNSNACAYGNNPSANKKKAKRISSRNNKRRKLKKNQFLTSSPVGEKFAKFCKHKNSQKLKTNQTKEQKLVENNIIVIETSDDENEVIEVITKPPPTLVVDSSDSSDVEIDELNDDPYFIKPKLVSKPSTNKTIENSSRCTSPSSSIFSDDFIGHFDRSRLLEADIPKDDDLQQCIKKNDNQIKNTVDTIQLLNSSEQDHSNEEQCESLINSNEKFIEEEESDDEISIYSKGKSDKIRHQNRKKPYKFEESQNLKRKCSEKRDLSKKIFKVTSKKFPYESTDESTENEVAIPIKQGEAIESFGVNLKKSSDQAFLPNECSDDEFISKLVKIVHGARRITTPNYDEDSDGSHKSDESNFITARSLAEEVLNRNSVKHSVVELDAEKRSHSKNLENKTINLADRVAGSIKISHNNSSVNSKQKSSSTSCSNANQKENNESNLIDLMKSCYVKKDKEHISWTDDMIKFYNQSWNGEKFNVMTIRRKMNHKCKWPIHHLDRFPPMKKFSKVKCNNCSVFGHMQSKCLQPKKRIVCHMCGEEGHREPRCPNTICLHCGRKTNYFVKSCNNCRRHKNSICRICKMRGHIEEICPDNWRRYHSTTKSNTEPNKSVTYNKRKFCCICAGRGHLPENCRMSLRFLDYPVVTTEIKSNVDCYDNVEIPYSEEIGYHLISEPNKNIKFNFSDNVSENNYYGRFLSAVGLEKEYSSKKEVELNKNASLQYDMKDNIRKKDCVGKLTLSPFPEKAKRIVKKSELSQRNNALITEHGEESLNEGEITKCQSKSDLFNYEKSVEKHDNIIDTTEKMFEFQKNQFNNEKNEPHINFENDNLSDTINLCDADSNYSFSELDAHVSSSINNKESCTKKDNQSIEDFIPLDSKDEQNQHSILFNKQVVSHDVQVKDTQCEAKIYLRNIDSKYLLSPEGNKFLCEKSIEFDLKTELVSSSVGYILKITGFPCNQDKLHSEIQTLFNNLSFDIKRKTVEVSQKLPKKTKSVIRFIQENIQQLGQYLGNVTEIHKKIKICNTHNTRANFKIIIKLKRLLNMILVGQCGFENGYHHLNTLQVLLENLLNESLEEKVSDIFRNKICEHWKYIFSPFQDYNYEVLIEQYMSMKRLKTLTKPNLNLALLEKAQALSKVSTNTNKKNTNQALTDMIFPNPNKSGTPERQCAKISKVIVASADSTINSVSSSTNDDQITVLETKLPSPFWSLKCAELLQKFFGATNINSLIADKLQMVYDKAQNGLLCCSDYNYALEICSQIDTSIINEIISIE